MGILREISNGTKASETGLLECPSGVFGGCLISTDGTNAAVVVIRNTDASGKIVFQISTKSTGAYILPTEAEQTIHYSVSGTNAEAEFFEYTY